MADLQTVSLFDSPLADSARKKAAHLGRYACPLAYWVASAAEAEAERRRLDDLFATIPEKHRADLRARLLSKEDNKHVAALYELEVWHFFSQRDGWSAVYQPALEFGTPDLEVVAPGGDNFYVEVMTTFEAAERSAREGRVTFFMDQLDALEHHFIINVDSISVHHGAKPSAFGRFVKSRLDELHAQGGDSQPQKIEYNDGSAFVLLTAHRRDGNERGPVLLGRMHQLRMLPPAPFKNRMESKIKKYSAIRDTDVGFVLAIGVAELIFREAGVVNTMYGPEQLKLQIDRRTGRQLGGDEHTRDFAAGILWDYEGGPTATHFSGALEVHSRWVVEDEAEVRRPTFRYCHNVWSSRGIPPEQLDDLPQWALPGDTPDTLSARWAWWKDGRAVPVNDCR